MGPGPIGPIWAWDPLGPFGPIGPIGARDPLGPFGPGTHLGPLGPLAHLGPGPIWAHLGPLAPFGPIWAHWLVGVKHLIASMNSVTLVGGIGINTWSRKVSRSLTFN